ncbi:hypothetical protein SRIMM317S_04282 [Streptomyces rimosus subsp. rimosus]
MVVHKPANSDAASAVVRRPSSGVHTRNAPYRAIAEASASTVRSRVTEGETARIGAIRKLMPRERGALK